MRSSEFRRKFKESDEWVAKHRWFPNPLWRVLRPVFIAGAYGGLFCASSLILGATVRLLGGSVGDTSSVVFRLGVAVLFLVYGLILVIVLLSLRDRLRQRIIDPELIVMLVGILLGFGVGILSIDFAEQDIQNRAILESTDGAVDDENPSDPSTPETGE